MPTYQTQQIAGEIQETYVMYRFKILVDGVTVKDAVTGGLTDKVFEFSVQRGAIQAEIQQSLANFLATYKTNTESQVTLFTLTEVSL